MTHRFEIEPRPASLGGGVFPPEDGISENEPYADALQTGEDWLVGLSGSEA